MKAFAEHNFGNEGAMAYLSVLTARLVATITEIVADPERRRLDEDGESMLMPSVEILALLCERYNAAPPRRETVRQWADSYLQTFDEGIDALRADERFRAARRKSVENTFRWLEGLAASYWDE